MILVPLVGSTNTGSSRAAKWLRTPPPGIPMLPSLFPSRCGYRLWHSPVCWLALPETSGCYGGWTESRYLYPGIPVSRWETGHRSVSVIERSSLSCVTAIGSVRQPSFLSTSGEPGHPVTLALFPGFWHRLLVDGDLLLV